LLACAGGTATIRDEVLWWLALLIGRRVKAWKETLVSYWDALRLPRHSLRTVVASELAEKGVVYKPLGIYLFYMVSNY
jgi:hypothetical protein